jgi:hypothetical protein
MKTLSREEIFSADDLPSEVVPVPEWGANAQVRVRAFDLATRQAYYKPVMGIEPQSDEMRAAVAEIHGARLAVFAIVDDEGKPVFTEADIPALLKKNPKALDRIVAAASRLNGLGAQAQEQAAGN